jgi:hypothetical protein
VTPLDQPRTAHTRRTCAAVLVALLLVGCTAPPVQRPREGAPPIAGGTPVRLESVVPPTLASASSLIQTATQIPGDAASPSPAVALSPAPAGSPGLSPIISGLQPAPGASLPPGDVVISARISGSADLVDVTAFVDGDAIPIEPMGPSVRTKTVSFVRTLAAGAHEVRIQARDERNQLGGYRWQFSVGAGRSPAAAPSAPPGQPTAPPPAAKPAAPTPAIQVRTPPPVPTRRPTVVLPVTPAPGTPVPKPAAR